MPGPRSSSSPTTRSSTSRLSRARSRRQASRRRRLDPRRASGAVRPRIDASVCRHGPSLRTIAAMLLRDVGYARPRTTDEALGLLAEHEGARPLAGGQTLINVMKARVAAPDVLVDLNGIEELTGIELRSDGTLEIGPMTTTSQLIASQEARARPILGEVCSQIADVQVRNRGTVGGNICASDPTNHLPPVLVAAGAEMTIVGRGGDRTVPAEEFFLGVYMTAVSPGELLTKITVPPGRSDGFSSVAVGRDGTCIVNAAASANGGLRVVLGCVGAVPELLRPDSVDPD